MESFRKIQDEDYFNVIDKIPDRRWERFVRLVLRLSETTIVELKHDNPRLSAQKLQALKEWEAKQESKVDKRTLSDLVDNFLHGTEPGNAACKKRRLMTAGIDNDQPRNVFINSNVTIVKARTDNNSPSVSAPDRRGGDEGSVVGVGISPKGNNDEDGLGKIGGKVRDCPDVEIVEHEYIEEGGDNEGKEALLTRISEEVCKALDGVPLQIGAGRNTYPGAGILAHEKFVEFVNEGSKTRCEKGRDISKNFDGKVRNPKGIVNPVMTKTNFFVGGAILDERNYTITDERASKIKARKGKEITTPLQDIHVHGQYIFLIGSAGSGKTTLIKRYTEMVIQKQVKALVDVKMTHLVNIRDVARKTVTPKDMLFGKFLPGKNKRIIDAGYEWLQNESNQRSLLLAFDGLDTVPWDMRDGKHECISYDDEATADTIMFNILSGHLFKNCWIVVTAREYAIAQFPRRIRPDAVVVIKGLARSSIEILVKELAGTHGNAIWEYLRGKSSYMMLLCANPLFLILTVIMRMAGEELPANISGTILKIIQSHLYSENGHIEPKAIEKTLEKLEKLSLCGLQEGKVVFSKSHFDQFQLEIKDVEYIIISAPAPDRGFYKQKIVEKDYDLFFCHQSFQEALGALGVARKELAHFKKFIEDDVHKVYFTVVRQMLCGFLFGENVQLSSSKYTDIEKKRSTLLKSFEKQLKQKKDSPMALLNLLISLRECGQNDAVTRMIRKCLPKIDISGIPLSMADMHAIATMARQCEKLDIMKLVDSKLSDQGLEVLAEEMRGSDVELEDLNVSGNNSLGPKGILILGKLVKNHEVKKLHAAFCNLSSECLQNLMEGLEKATVHELDIHAPSLGPSAHYTGSLLDLLSKVENKLDLRYWKINEGQRQELQDRLNEIRSPSLKIVLGTYEKQMYLKADLSVESHITNEREENLIRPYSTEIHFNLAAPLSKVTLDQKLHSLREFAKLIDFEDKVFTTDFQRINFSGGALGSRDIATVGSVINLSNNLEMVNLKNCNLESGSLSRLAARVKTPGKIGKLSVTGNPQLTIDDLISGTSLCARTKASFNYDGTHLSEKEYQKLKLHVKSLQDSSEEVTKKRTYLTRAEKFRRFVNKRTDEIKRKNRVFHFESKAIDASDQERYSTTSDATASAKDDNVIKSVSTSDAGNERTSTVPTFASYRSDLEAISEEVEGHLFQSNINSDDGKERSSVTSTFEGHGAGLKPISKEVEEQGYQIKIKERKRNPRQKFVPRNVKDAVRLKPMMKLAKKMNSQEETASLYDMNRHDRYMTKRVSTLIVKSSKGDSGYSRSTFSEIMNSHKSLKRFSQTTETDHENHASIESTHDSLSNANEMSDGSVDSGVNEYDPRRVAEQKFEMTILGLGIMESKRQQTLSWLESASFNLNPSHMSYEADECCLKELVREEQSEDDTINAVMNELLARVEELHQELIAGFTTEPDPVEEYISRMDKVFEQIYTGKTTKIQNLSPEGGLLELDGSGIRFPQDSVNKNTDVQVWLDNNEDDLPEDMIAISPSIKCKPSKFNVPVVVRLTTWFSAKNGKKIKVIILSKSKSQTEWKTLQETVLTNTTSIEYEASHFCRHQPVISSRDKEVVEHHLFNDVWMNVQNARIVSVFCKDRPAMDISRDELDKEKLHKRIISVSRELFVSVGDIIRAEVKSNDSQIMSFKSHGGEGNGKLKITERNLKMNSHPLYFDPLPHPQKLDPAQQGELKVSYHVELLNSDSESIEGGFNDPLNFCWPQSPQENVKRDAASPGPSRGIQQINIHGGIHSSRDIGVGAQGQNVDNRQAIQNSAQRAIESMERTDRGLTRQARHNSESDSDSSEKDENGNRATPKGK